MPLLVILRLSLLLSILTVDAQLNPPCCVCFDQCVSTITRPTVIIPLPVNPLLPESATCEEIRRAAEDTRLIPAIFCPLLDRQDFREAW